MLHQDANQTQKLDPSGPHVGCGHRMAMTPTAVHDQIAAGAALDVSTGFQFPPNNGRVGYSLLLTLGAGAVPCTITVTGLAPDGVTEVVETFSVTGAGDVEGDTPAGVGFSAITNVASDVDPEGTVDISTLDLFAHDFFRGIYVNGAGELSYLMPDDTIDTTVTLFDGGFPNIAWTRIRCDQAGRSGITPSGADITVGR